MGVDVAHQLQVALGAAALGVKLCLVFELVRVSGYFLHGPFWRFVLDFGQILWWGIAVFVYFRRAADGQVRLYDLIILLVAAGLFHFCIGRFLVRPLRSLFRFVLLVFRRALALLLHLLAPIGCLLRKISAFFTKIADPFLKKGFIFLKRYIIMIPYLIFRKKNKVKEAPQNENISRFYH